MSKYPKVSASPLSILLFITYSNHKVIPIIIACIKLVSKYMLLCFKSMSASNNAHKRKSMTFNDELMLLRVSVILKISIVYIHFEIMISLFCKPQFLLF